MSWGEVSVGQFRGNEWRLEYWDTLRSSPASAPDWPPANSFRLSVEWGREGGRGREREGGREGGREREGDL